MGESAGRPRRLNPEAAPPNGHVKFGRGKASWFADVISSESTDSDYEDGLFEDEKGEPAEVETDQESESSKSGSEVDSKLECEELEGEAEEARMKVVTLRKGSPDSQVTCAC